MGNGWRYALLGSADILTLASMVPFCAADSGFVLPLGATLGRSPLSVTSCLWNLFMLSGISNLFAQMQDFDSSSHCYSRLSYAYCPLY